MSGQLPAGQGDVLAGHSFTIKTIPGDKSISHRAIILASLSESTVTFTNFLCSDDCLNTVTIFRSCGVQIAQEGTTVTVHGVGLHGLKSPAGGCLDVGNAGTAIRLLAGVFAGQSFPVTLTGDAAIRSRPMARVIKPLKRMGAVISASTTGTPPLDSRPVKSLQPITYTLPVASAQVKSAVLLASLYSTERSTVCEPIETRDHTERMLHFFSADVFTEPNRHPVNGRVTRCSGRSPLRARATEYAIPSDLSSAMFFTVLGLIVKETQIDCLAVGVNPLRTGVLTAMARLGFGQRGSSQATVTDGQEPVEDLLMGRLEPIGFDDEVIFSGSDISDMIDEIPILSVLACFGDKRFVIQDAAELRVKESDRIKTTLAVVRCLGATEVEESADGFSFMPSQQFKPVDIDCQYDHRIAMAAIVGAIGANQPATIEGWEAIQTSFPSFFDHLAELGVDVSGFQ